MNWTCRSMDVESLEFLPLPLLFYYFFFLPLSLSSPASILPSLPTLPCSFFPPTILLSFTFPLSSYALHNSLSFLLYLPYLTILIFSNINPSSPPSLPPPPFSIILFFIPHFYIFKPFPSALSSLPLPLLSKSSPPTIPDVISNFLKFSKLNGVLTYLKMLITNQLLK